MMKQHILVRLLLACLVSIPAAVRVHSQQIAIPRIDLMPDRPSPYLMRDWKAVARGYDSLVFNLNAAGTYLPLSWINTNTINYPAQNSFGLHTVVGTTVPGSAEAINCLPAVIGASLSGIDKSSQNGRNWALMAQEWFNRRPEQNIYKNHWVDDGGDDWWYETMPNVFFLQLNDLYPATGDFTYQVKTVADRWLQAVAAMGGRTTPWDFPNMNHRGWMMQTMTPYDAGVREPEAAGAIAWVLYAAYRSTGAAQYRIGAEQSMEFLNQLVVNPSYELQLSYGASLAARMNAEIGTTYDVQKIVNWCFDVGPLRSWGAMTGTWGGFDCSGLIGEVNGSNNYAFAMNTFEQIGALVPMVRYDPRFARAIGKWILNAANASRLFYRPFLPPNGQDSYAWSQQYDTAGVIGHEALRQFNGGISPYATGDAISGGWGATNLTLYGSSHAGILGGIIDTTDVPMVLKLDLLKTDYYHAPAYPSYLLFNPYDSAVTVAFDAGSGTHDLYDLVSKSVVVSGAAGVTSLILPAGGAVAVVVMPSGGTATYAGDRLLVNGIVVDFHSGHGPLNRPPRIKALAPNRTTILRGDTVTVYCTATDPDGDSLAYLWHAGTGTINGSGAVIRWIAPDSVVSDSIRCIVTDGNGNADTAVFGCSVLGELNSPPVIAGCFAHPRKLPPGGTTQLLCRATDPEGDSISFRWTTADGTPIGNDSVISWVVPGTPGNYAAFCTATDNRGASSADSVLLEVRDTTAQQTGTLVMWLPFTGNANDATGNHHDGIVHGALLTDDRFGTPNSAYSFNGTTAYIQVPNATDLNFQQAITISFWMRIAAFSTNEEHPVSHGSWQNRWKVSVGNQHLRWTVKTTSGVRDLDSPTLLQTNHTYHVAGCYNGSDMELYLDGYLDAFTSFSGTILPATIDLTIGQVLPTDPNYNFNGVLDDIRLYDYALSYGAIQNLVSGVTGVRDGPAGGLPVATQLRDCYPNPFNASTTISYDLASGAGSSAVSLDVFDLLGRKVAALAAGKPAAGRYAVRWDAAGEASGIYVVRLSAGGAGMTRKILLIR